MPSLNKNKASTCSLLQIDQLRHGPVHRFLGTEIRRADLSKDRHGSGILSNRFGRKLSISLSTYISLTDHDTSFAATWQLSANRLPWHFELQASVRRFNGI
jgi:hypothetical protein